MSKLFKLKKWFTILDASKHLSSVISEEIPEAEVLRLVLDGYIKISLRLIRSVRAQEVIEIVPHNTEISDLDGSVVNLADHDKWVQSEKGILKCQERFNLGEGLYDVVLTHDIRLYIEHLRLKKIDNYFESEKIICRSCQLEGIDGLFHIVFYPSFNGEWLDLSEYGELVFRMDNLIKFEQTFMSTSNSINTSTESIGRREQQHEVILAVISKLNYEPLKIPDGGKATIKKTCLTRPRLFTDASFDHAWKEGVSAGYFRLANHKKYSSKS